MKYGNYLIVTLPDFRRHFDFNTFYRNRYQFVTDMHPDKVYYWGNDKLIRAYDTLSNWILNDFGQEINDIPADVINALQCLVGRAIPKPNLKTNGIELTEDIITLSPGQNVSLPLYEQMEIPDPIKIKLHKIVISGESEMPAVVTAGKESREISQGDVIYITECNGNFIEFISTFDENEFLTGQLIDSSEQFGSILVITDKTDGRKQTINGVVSFILVDKGYIYINERGRLVTIDNDVPMVLLRINESHAVQIKRKGNSIAVLYHNGVCKSTTSLSSLQGVLRI